MSYEGVEEETIKINKLKIGKYNTKFIFNLKKNSAISLPVKWEVCDKSTFLSLCQAKGADYPCFQLSFHPSGAGLAQAV
jgi:hypothetical protein